MSDVTVRNPGIGLVLEASKAIASDSLDHQFPWGTRQDNSMNPRFNYKVYALYAQRAESGLKILDLGCSGGGFVRNCIDDGHFAVGLEGSDYSRRFQRAEWATIPQFLFTCDVTHPFKLFLDGEPLRFDVITSWEMIEHIDEGNLKGLSENCALHLKPDGLWMMSVSAVEDVKFGQQLHRTVEPKPWWIKKFASLGWTHHEEYLDYFRGQFVRGPHYGAPNSFHLVLSHGDGELPVPRRIGPAGKLYDSWLNCNFHRFLKAILIEPPNGRGGY
ncbi:MAG: class I SAM-dependent methyltransferase [Bryobacteraceae bacterium]